MISRTCSLSGVWDSVDLTLCTSFSSINTVSFDTHVRSVLVLLLNQKKVFELLFFGSYLILFFTRNHFSNSWPCMYVKYRNQAISIRSCKYLPGIVGDFCKAHLNVNLLCNVNIHGVKTSFPRQCSKTFEKSELYQTLKKYTEIIMSHIWLELMLQGVASLFSSILPDKKQWKSIRRWLLWVIQS